MSTNPRPELLRVLGLWTAVAVTAGSVIGSGIFKKPQAVAQNIQHFEWVAVAWVLGGVLAILGALALAELGAMLPRAGGSYVYLKEGYGPLWGFLWGWIEFLILRTGSIAALATVFTELLAELIKARGVVLGPWEQRWITVTVISLLAGVNALGVRWGGLVQSVTTWLKVGSLAAIALLPFLLARAHTELLGQPGPLPKSGNVFIGFGAAVLGVLWAYHGWMNLSTLGEEVREPQRNVPRALLGGVGIVILVYLGANLAYAVVLPQSVMADVSQVSVVAVSFAEELFGSWGSSARDIAGKAISAAIMVSVFGALNANILIGPRTYFALGRDGLFPTFLGRVHERFRTPVMAILLQAAWACCLVLGSDLIRENPLPNGQEPLRKDAPFLAGEKVLTGAACALQPLAMPAFTAPATLALSHRPQADAPFDTLTNFVMYAAVFFETMVIASILRFRRTRPELPRPYRCWGYPVVPIIYIGIMALVFANTVYDQRRKALVGLGIVLAGAAVYWLVKKTRTSRDREGAVGPSDEKPLPDSRG
jgi:basic amino acid/polyamine antiporter, APA family